MFFLHGRRGILFMFRFEIGKDLQFALIKNGYPELSLTIVLPNEFISTPLTVNHNEESTSTTTLEVSTVVIISMVVKTN